MKNIYIIILGSLVALCASADESIVSQKNKTFIPGKLTVKVGDTVHFKNEDPFFHNVFSLSDAALFDLGSYPQGESKPVKFEEAGVVEVECAIHPEMHLTIEVVE